MLMLMLMLVLVLVSKPNGCIADVDADAGRLAWSDPKKANPMLARIPVGRFAETEDVVNAILYLLSEKSGMCNGVMLPIDGGYRAS
jgi:L-xylulose reductase